MTVNNDYNRVQINETIERDQNGNIYKRSLMLNIREESVAKAEELYLDLKRRLNGQVVVLNNKSEKNNGKGPICECGAPMVKRKGRRGEFYGCVSYPLCNGTKQIEEIAEIQLETVPF